MIRRRSCLSLGIHLVWSTKNRGRLITDDVEGRLHRFLAAAARLRRCDVLAVGGTKDHVHLLLAMPATICLSDRVRELKTASSKFLKEIVEPGAEFAWQDNYGAIAVSPSHRTQIVAYIHNQKAHHANEDTRELFERDCEFYDTEQPELSEGQAAAGVQRGVKNPLTAPGQLRAQRIGANIPMIPRGR